MLKKKGSISYCLIKLYSHVMMRDIIICFLNKSGDMVDFIVNVQ